MPVHEGVVRVLAIDDSAVVRTLYRELLSPRHDIDLVATAPNAEIARRKLVTLDYDVVVLDIEMPGEDGLSLLRWLMSHQPVPVVVASSWSSRGAEQTMEAFALGAVEVVCKGSLGASSALQDFSAALLSAVRAAAGARRRLPRRQPPSNIGQMEVPASSLRRSMVVVIGASTGGTEVLARLISQMPAQFPPTLVVQHMPALYTRAFANRLNTLGVVRVSEAEHGQMIGAGEVLVAPGGVQMRLLPGGRGPVAQISAEGPVNRHAPSVDVLFDSARDHYRNRTVGVLLTGMGNDGARGLLGIRQAGGRTIAQNEVSSVVWGMPQEAVRLDAAEAVLAPDEMIARIIDWVQQ
jgi:two-component system, chemotaxis family, protein-glutamate methylesterase/glutaminase